MSTSGHFIRGFFTLGVGQVFSWIGAIALTVVLPRQLDDVNLGKFAFALAFTQLVGLVADLGTPTYLTKELARDRARTPVLVANALALRVPLALAAVVAAVLIVNLAGYEPATRNLVYVLSVGIVLSTLGNVVCGCLQGLQEMRALAAYSVITKLGYAGLVIAFLAAGSGPMAVAIAWVTSLALGLLACAVVLLRLVPLSLRIDLGTWREILRGGLPFFVWQAALMVYGQIDAVLLSLLTHDAVVGWYAAAYRFVAIPGFVPTILIMLAFPALSAAAINQPIFNAIARRTLHIVALASLPMALGIMLLADKLIGLLGYPAGFTNSIVPLVVLAAGIPLVAIDMIIGTILNTRDRQRQWALTAVAAALLNPLLNVVAISYTQTTYANGAIGAAAITTLTEVFMMAVGLRLLPAGVLDKTSFVGVLKCLLSGLVMALAVGLTRDLPLVVPVLLGAVVYGTSSLALGAVSLGDINQVRLQLVRRHTISASA